jgi:diadenosine tetraphosphate (Ap4A) HIT family hydrolase
MERTTESNVHVLGYSIGLSTCPYCAMSPEDAWIMTEFVVALPHDHPLTPCHTVVAPRRHVAAFYDLDVQEQRMMWDVVGEIRKRVTSTLRVEGFDIGFADSSPDREDPVHAHIHVVPRTLGAPVHLPPGIEWVYLGSNSPPA